MSEPIHTVVSKPGPVERSILDDLSGVVAERRVVSAGVSLRVLDTGGAFDRPTCVLLHGRGHAATMWAPFFRALGARRRVIAVDLPGFGHSAMRDAAPRSPEEALALFVDPIEALLSSIGRDGERFVLVGHSLGGLVALELTLRARAPIAGLVLVCAMGLGPHVAAKARAYLRVGPERIRSVTRVLGVAAPGLTRGGDAMQPLRDELYGAGSRAHGKRAFDRLAPLFAEPFHRRDSLGAVGVPVCLVWGSRDDAFPVPVAMDASTRLRDASLEVLDAGHSPHIEKPAEVASILESFLAARVDSR